jgi:anti-anti-sigma factor
MSTKPSPVAGLAQLRIDTSCPLPGTARAAVAGEVDLATVPVLRDTLLNVLCDQHPAVLDVDLAEVTFLDCTGLGVLVAVRNAAVRTGSRLRVTNPQPIVRQILEVTGLLGVLTAEVDQPPPVPTRSEYPSQIGPAPAAPMQPPAMLVAAWPKPLPVAELISADDQGMDGRPANPMASSDQEQRWAGLAGMSGLEGWGNARGRQGRWSVQRCELDGTSAAAVAGIEQAVDPKRASPAATMSSIAVP